MWIPKAHIAAWARRQPRNAKAGTLIPVVRGRAMKAAWYEKQGPARDVLVVGEMDDPQPRAGEVRIRVAFSGVNPGDVKKREDAFGVGGAWLGWTMIPVAVELAALAAIASYLVTSLLSGHRLRATARLPFGLFLAPAIWFCWMLGVMLFDT